MKVLLVDDDQQRRRALAAALRKSPDFREVQVLDIDCVDVAKRNLSTTYFDVLILDVVLPKRVGESPSGHHGLNLLRQIGRSHRLKKPGKVIGLTSHLDDIAHFRVEFAKYCFTVVEAPKGGTRWVRQVFDAISYAKDARLGESLDTLHTRILTVHGIRTFGAWQQRLESIIVDHVPMVGFHTYKYGLFSVLAFLVPLLMRRREVLRLVRALEDLFASFPNERFMIFAHSFGTYLVAYALRDLSSRMPRIPVHTLVLCGSPLRSSFDWRFLRQSSTRVINECADDDYVLWLSEAFVLGMGMAGKRGFYGIQDRFLVNRYFAGGHNTYVRSAEFMKQYWVPLLDAGNPVSIVDLRKQSPIKHEIIEKIVMLLGWLKPCLYLAAAGAFLLYIIKAS